MRPGLEDSFAMLGPLAEAMIVVGIYLVVGTVVLLLFSSWGADMHDPDAAVPEAEPIRRFCGWIRDDNCLANGWTYAGTSDNEADLNDVLRATCGDAEFRAGRNLTYVVTTGVYPGGDKESERIPCQRCSSTGKRFGAPCNNCRGKGYVSFL